MESLNSGPVQSQSGSITSPRRNTMPASARAGHSSSTHENAIVLCVLLVLSAAYLLAAAIRRKIYERRANERKRRLLGVPINPTVIASSNSTGVNLSAETAKTASSLANTLRGLVMPSRNRHRNNNRTHLANEEANKAGALSVPGAAKNDTNGFSHASPDVGNGSKKQASTANASPVREIRGRATLNADSPQPLSSLSLAGKNSMVTSPSAASRGNSRSFSSGSHSNNKYKQHTPSREGSVPYAKGPDRKEKEREIDAEKDRIRVSVRSIGVQVPPEAEMEGERERYEEEATDRASHRSADQEPAAPPPPYDVAASFAEANGSEIRYASNTSSSPLTRKEVGAAVQQRSNANEPTSSMEVRTSPSLPSGITSGSSPSRPGRKARAAINRQVTRASIPGIAAPTSSDQRISPGKDTSNLASSLGDQDAVDSTSTSTSYSVSVSASDTSQDSSLSDSSASQLLEVDACNSSVQMKGYKDSQSTSTENIAVQRSHQQQAFQPYCFHEGFQTETVENHNHEEALAYQQSHPLLQGSYLPTPPHSERKIRMEENGHTPISIQQEMSSTTPPFSPLAAKEARSVNRDLPFDSNQASMSSAYRRPHQDYLPLQSEHHHQHQYQHQTQQQQQQQQQQHQQAQPFTHVISSPYYFTSLPHSVAFPSLSVPFSSSSRPTSPQPSLQRNPQTQLLEVGMASTSSLPHQIELQQAQQLSLLNSMQIMQAQLHHAAQHTQMQAQTQGPAQYLLSNGQQAFNIHQEQQSMQVNGMPAPPVPLVEQNTSLAQTYPLYVTSPFPLSDSYISPTVLPPNVYNAGADPLLPHAPYGASSTQWLNGTSMYYSKPEVSSTSASVASGSSPRPSRRRSSQNANDASSKASLSLQANAASGHKSSKRDRRAGRPSGRVHDDASVMPSPTQSQHGSLGSERLDSPSFYHNSRKPPNNIKRRHSTAPGSPSYLSAHTRAEVEELERGNDSVIQPDLDILKSMENDEDVAVEALLKKMKSMEVVLERRGKELEIARWRLKCVEVDRKGTEAEVSHVQIYKHHVCVISS